MALKERLDSLFARLEAARKGIIGSISGKGVEVPPDTRISGLAHYIDRIRASSGTESGHYDSESPFERGMAFGFIIDLRAMKNGGRGFFGNDSNVIGSDVLLIDSCEIHSQGILVSSLGNPFPLEHMEPFPPNSEESSR